MLLNCIGAIILHYSGSEISYSGLGTLEFFKDIPIAIMSLITVNLINRTGTKNALMSALALVFISCSIIPFVDEFWFLRIWFVVIGISFAMAKISVFAIIRNNAEDEKALSKVMNVVEASFMIGLFLVNIGFGWILESQYSEYWKFGFWLISALALINIIMLRNRDYIEISASENKFDLNFKEIFTGKNCIFFIILFLIVFIEQGFNSWLPTFNKHHLGVNSFYALQSSAFLALFSFIGRIVTSRLIEKYNWWTYIANSIMLSALIMVFCQSLVFYIDDNISYLIFIFPIIGLFLSPLYPLFNSKFLSSLEKEKINMYISLIVIFSSLGGSFGSLMMAYIFQFSLSEYFVSFSLLPLILIFFLSLIFINRNNSTK